MYRQVYGGGPPPTIFSTISTLCQKPLSKFEVKNTEAGPDVGSDAPFNVGPTSVAGIAVGVMS